MSNHKRIEYVYLCILRCAECEALMSKMTVFPQAPKIDYLDDPLPLECTECG